MLSRLAPWLRTASVYILVIILIVIAWWGLMTVRAVSIDSCKNGCQNFASYMRHDPYCIVDPACMSPFYKSTWNSAGSDPEFMPHWQGYAWLGEAGTYGEASRMLAVPNYVCFLVLLATLIVLVTRKVHRTHVRRLLVVAIITWIVLEVLRWFAIMTSVDPTVSFVSGELFLVMMLSLFAVWCGAAASRKIAAIHLKVHQRGT